MKFISLKIAGISLGFVLRLELALTLILVLIGASSCSVYKSDGRKNLESVGPSYYQNKVTATAVLVPAPVLNTYLIQHPENIVYDLCEAQNTIYINEQSTEMKCSFKLSCIEISNLESERHSSLEPIEQLDHRLLLSPDAHRIFQKDLICVAR